MRAAFYECDITPPLGGFLWGHYAHKFAYDVNDRLYAKAMVVEDANGELAAIVCIDSCSMPPEMHDAVTKRIYEFTGIPAERVCLTANHTHWGAPICDSPELDCYADAAYKDVVFRLTADAVTLAYKRLGDADAKFGTSEVEGISFCRDYVLEGGHTITFNGAGRKTERMLAEIDPSLAVMLFERDGRPIGAVINFACHQCCCGAIDGYSGDYSSELSRRLKEVYGQDFVSLFVLGTCGDINHVDTDKTKPGAPAGWYLEMGRRIARQTLDAIEKATPCGDGIEIVKESITIPKRTAELAETLKRTAALTEIDGNFMRLRNLVVYQATNRDTTCELNIQAFRIGNVCFYALPGEVFVNFGFKLKGASKFKNNIVIENCNCYCGYIPTPEAFGEDCDLYETSLCRHSCLVPEAGDMLTDRLLELAGGFGDVQI